MSNIIELVERLRAAAPAGGSSIVCTNGTTRELNADINKAAETIIGLRKEVERLAVDGIHTCHADCHRIVCVLRRELDEANSSILSFAAPWVVTYARDLGLPDGHLHPTHYDILAKAGGRMDDFTRAALATEAE